FRSDAVDDIFLFVQFLCTSPFHRRRVQLSRPMEIGYQRSGTRWYSDCKIQDEGMMNLESKGMRVPQPQRMTLPVAAGAIIVVILLSSAVYSVLHYLF